VPGRPRWLAHADRFARPPLHYGAPCLPTIDLGKYLVYYMTMSDVILNIHEAKSHLSRHLNRLTADDRIVVCKRNRPVAELRLLPPEREKPRRLGTARGKFTVPGTFFEPLPDETLAAFEGGGS